MKRFAITDYGEAATVFTTIEALPRPVTSQHIRVSIQAFGINPYDISLRQGAMKNVRELKFPYVLGNDGAGIVTEVAEDVTDFKVGDRVVLHAVGGTYGEEIVLPTKKASQLPDAIDWAHAAGMVTVGITAYNLLYHALQISKSATVMVQGASGGVGSCLVQLLKQNGNKVLATASSKNKSYVESLGVDSFSAYDKEDSGKIFSDQADIVIDATKGSRGITSGVKSMKNGGTYVALNDLPSKEQQVKEGKYLHFAPSKEYADREALDFLIQSYLKGNFRIHIATHLPFDLSGIIKGHELLEGHPPAGKIVLEK
ncbi:MAG: NADP-dependent oxidoreductase [Enterococcus sp.]